jgi:SAM-dependent methyltransferase
MSNSDKTKWEQRYREGAYQDRTHPSVFLEDCLPQIQKAQQHRPALRALDIACGAGRNSLFLARQGCQVDAVDISSEALDRAKASARNAELSGITWIEHDLELGLPATCGNYDLIVMIRYLNLPLLRSVSSHLNPEGFLLSEVHMRSDAEVGGPEGTRFRAEAGELKAAAPAMSIEVYWEGLEEDPDGRKMALARILARQK